jgi:hypothetical protein
MTMLDVVVVVDDVFVGGGSDCCRFKGDCGEVV